MKYSYFIFDLDGTLLNTSDGIFTAFELFMRANNIEVPDKQGMRKFIGPQIVDSFRDEFGFTDEELPEKIMEFRDIYEENNCTMRACVYEGNIELLDYIKSTGKPCAVATFKYEPLAVEVLGKFGIGDYFTAVGGSPAEGGATKKQLIESALEKMGCTDKSQAVMIGDTTMDGKGAMEAGVDFIACGYGFGEIADLQACNPVIIVDSPLEIIDFIK